MMSKTLLVIAVALCCASMVSATVGFSNCTQSFIAGAVPYQPDGAVQICRDGAIAISYDTKMINPAWSAYYMTPYEINHEVVPGRDTFYEDPDLKKLDVKQASIYDKVWSETWNKGHLCPSNAMSYSEDTKHATYTMANVAPQFGQFNQVGWGALEDALHKWIGSHTAVYIITGVMYDDRNNAKRGKSGVAYPDYYFKVVCDPAAHQSVGFYGKNEEGSAPANDFKAVQDVEKIFGGTLLPDSNCKTSTVDNSYWW